MQNCLALLLLAGAVQTQDFPLIRTRTDHGGQEIGGYWTSSLAHVGPSVFTTACYLFQGFPDAVIGSSFGYCSPGPSHCELFLLSLLRSKRNSETCKVLIGIASATYVDGRGKVSIVLKPESRWSYLKRVDDQLKFSGLSGYPRMLLLVLKAYLDPDTSEESLKQVAMLNAGVISTGKRVATNARAIMRTLSFVTSKAKGYERPFVVR